MAAKLLIVAFLFQTTWTAGICDSRTSFSKLFDLPVRNCSKSDKPCIHIAGFFPMNPIDSQATLGRGVLPAVELALHHINKNLKLLPKYTLDIYWNNTMCNAAVGMKAFFDMIHQSPIKHMLFGAACTQVTDPVAKTSKFWHLTQLSYADTHPMFTKQNYPYLYRVVPSENEFNAPRVELLKRFNWTNVGTLFQNEPRYALAHNKLLNDIDDAKIHILTTQSFTDEVKTSLKKLKEQDVRIILGNFEEKWARRIFCQAYKMEMYGRKYQWIIVSMYDERWWELPDEQITCKPSELQQALEGYIATDLLPLRSNNSTTLSGLTADQYKKAYDTLRGLAYSRFHGYAYDGIWTIALALQAVESKLRARRRNLSLRKDFKYRDPYWGKLFVDALNATSFEGVTGPVRFINNDRQGFIVLKQFQGGNEEKIGEYNGLSAHLDLTAGKSISWRGSSTPPRDRTLIIIEHYRISITIYAVLATIASIGVIVASVFLVINIKFRNHRYIKMSSPYLNNLIIIGCILGYTSIILLGLDSELVSVQSLPYICTVRAWVLMAGFTLAFGSMFSKTWRVHAIFTNIKLNKKVIKDYQLFIVVGILLCIDLAIMTTWQTVDPFYRETKQLQSHVHPSNEDLLIIPELEYCKSDKMTIFMVVVYAYKGLLMVIGCFLAWETRHVSIPALNDSKYIGMSVYNAVIMCVMGAAISFLLSEQQNSAFLLISAFIIFCSTTTLCLVFVPKLVELKRNPNGSDKRVRTTFKPSGRKRLDSEESDLQEKIKQLLEENQKCRKTLREKDLELQALLKQLGESAVTVFGADLRERARAARRSDFVGRHREGLHAEEDDMNSVVSISSSPEGETTVTTTDSVERNRPSFSTQLPTIMASTEAIPTASIYVTEAITFEPLAPLMDVRTSDDRGDIYRQTTATATTTTNGGATRAEERNGRRARAQTREVHHNPIVEKRNKAKHAACRRHSDSDSEDSDHTCSVFTVSTGSPKLQLRRAFSWGKRGYVPMGSKKRQTQDEQYSELRQDDNCETRGATGSWPNISERRKSPFSPPSQAKKKFGKLSPKTLSFKRSVPRQISEKKRKSQQEVSPSIGKSYSSIKCDVVEYL